MELTSLKDRKYVYNTGKLPGYYVGKYPGEVLNVLGRINNVDITTGGDKAAMNAGRLSYKELKYGNKNNAQSSGIDYGSLVGGAGTVVTNTVNSFTDYAHEDDILAARDTATGYVEGIPYLKKVINKDVLEYAKDGRLPKYGYGKNIIGGISSGAAAGSALGPWGMAAGAAIGGIAGLVGSAVASSNEQEDLYKSQIETANENNASRNSARTIAQLLYNKKIYGDLNDLLLTRFACGKLPKYNLGKVATAFGEVYGEGNAYVSNGEVITREIAPGQFTAYRVPGQKNNQDGKIALLDKNDYVITNKNGSSDIAATGDIIGAINHMISTGNPKYKCGKLPKHAEGWLGNAIPAIAGGLASLGLYIDAKNSKPYYPKSYSSNPYELEGLTTLAGLRINPYPIISQLRSAEARTNRAVDIAGGLSGGQRSAARLAALNTTQNNISNLLSSIQQQNNAYKSAYAQAAINAGDASRKARMSANQWDYDMYARAHAARNKGIQTGIANMLSQIQQYQANEFKRRQFNETMDLYRADQKLRNEYNNWMKNTALNINNNADPIKNPGSQYFNQLSPYEKWMILLNRGIIS